MKQQLKRVPPHPAEVWSKAWCAYIESGMGLKSDKCATTATIFADAATEDYLARFPEAKLEPLPKRPETPKKE